MKYFLLIPFLLISTLHAVGDTQTNGSLKLLQPATGQAFDPNDSTKRSWGAKFNENFRIIDSSFTTAINDPSLAQRTQVWSDEGNPLTGGDVKGVNLVGAGVDAVQTGSTITLTVTASGSGGGATVAGSTQSMVLRVPTALLSTITVNGLNAYHSWGPSSATIVGIWADAVNASTAGWVKLDILISTGGIGGLPLAPDRFGPLSMSTASSLGKAGYTGFKSTNVPISAHEWIGVGISSMAQSGAVATGIQLHIDYWEFGRY